MSVCSPESRLTLTPATAQLEPAWRS